MSIRASRRLRISSDGLPLSWSRMAGPARSASFSSSAVAFCRVLYWGLLRSVMSLSITLGSGGGMGFKRSLRKATASLGDLARAAMARNASAASSLASCSQSLSRSLGASFGGCARTLAHDSSAKDSVNAGRRPWFMASEPPRMGSIRFGYSS